MFYVYSYIREDDGSPYYIGKGTGNRARCKFKKEIHPPVNEDCIKIISSNMAENDAFQLEMLLIYLHGRIDNGTGCLRNKTDGGEGWSGIVRSDEWKRKQGDRARNNWLSAEYRAKVLNRSRSGPKIGSKRGPMPQEVKDKIAASHMGKPGTNTGKPMPQHVKDALRAANLGRAPWNKKKQ